MMSYELSPDDLIEEESLKNATTDYLCEWLYINADRHVIAPPHHFYALSRPLIQKGSRKEN